MTKGKIKKISANSLLNYFKPLLTWLEVQNKEELYVGWTTGPHDTGKIMDDVITRR